MEGLYALASSWVPLSTLNDFVSPVGILTAALASLLQSTLPSNGTIPQVDLPYFLGESTRGFPWGNRTVDRTNPYTDIPSTGVIRYYDFTITRGVIAPDGVNKSSLLINNQYPGPLIEANWGDYIQVLLNNQIADPEEGTTLNWHGTSQRYTPWYDGSPAISQCPIAPGSSFTYKFKADSYGTAWYHSQYSAQYTAGLFGPMVVYGPTHVAYDLDLGPIMMHDYFRKDYQALIENTVGSDLLTALLTPSDNTLIEGSLNKYCALDAKAAHCISNGGLAKFKFMTGRTHRLRLINPSSVATPMLFSIDNHTMTIIANDYVPVVPYETDVVSLGAGQRTDVVVTATGKPGDTYWIRSRQPDLCNFVLQPFGLAVVYYDGADPDGLPSSLPQPGFQTPVLENCANVSIMDISTIQDDYLTIPWDPLAKTVPAYPIKADPNPDTSIVVNISLSVNSTNHTLYQMNGQSFRGDFSNPLLGLFAQANSTALLGNPTHAMLNTSTPSLGPQSNIYNFGNNKTIRILVLNSLPFSHPMHLHGQDMFVLAEGTGQWNGSIANPHNPQRRDTQILQANGYMVIQLMENHPGVFPFHCHIAWHLSAGLLINLVLMPDELNQSEVSVILAESCQAWNRYTAGQVVDEVDSGLK